LGPGSSLEYKAQQSTVKRKASREDYLLKVSKVKSLLSVYRLPDETYHNFFLSDRSTFSLVPSALEAGKIHQVFMVNLVTLGPPKKGVIEKK
jgi:hypothetical protein